MILVVVLDDNEFALLKKRDPEIVSRVYNECKEKVYRYLLSKTGGDRELADELFSETFLSMMDGIDSLAHADNIEGWVIRIAFRRFHDHLRKVYRERKREATLRSERYDETEGDSEAGRDEQIALLHAGLEKVKPAYRDVLRAKYIEEKSQKEIAQTMGKSEKAVESLLMRAKAAIKKEIQKIEGMRLA